MRRSRFAEEQIIGVLKEAEAGAMRGAVAHLRRCSGWASGGRSNPWFQRREAAGAGAGAPPARLAAAACSAAAGGFTINRRKAQRLDQEEGLTVRRRRGPLARGRPRPCRRCPTSAGARTLSARQQRLDSQLWLDEGWRSDHFDSTLVKVVGGHERTGCCLEFPSAL